MVKVEFKYKWFGIPRTISREVPTDYKSMTEQQFHALVQLSKSYISEERFFCKYFKIPMKVLAKLDTFQLYMLTERVRLDHDDKGIDEFIIKHVGRLVAPYGSKLRGMSFQQFITVDQLFGWYQYTGKRAYLNLMIANLYVERNPNDFFEGNFNDRLDRIMCMRESELYPAVVNWMMIKNWLAHAYKGLFPSSPEHKKVVSTRQLNQKKPRPADWLKVFDALVGDNLAFIDAYKHLECMDALRVLNNRILAQKE